MTPKVRGALLEWGSGALVGLIPLLAHALVWSVVDNTGGTTNGDWSVDILFIAITTSGLSVVNVFARVIRGTARLDGSFHLIVLMTITILNVCAGAIVYGVVASGHAHNPLIPVVLILIAALGASMYFELAMARRLTPPVAGVPA